MKAVNAVIEDLGWKKLGHLGGVGSCEHQGCEAACSSGLKDSAKRRGTSRARRCFGLAPLTSQRLCAY
jgi:hypothetical protein